jgi:hypothetical protein
MQGVSRRLKVLTRCIENVFELFPPARLEKLTKVALTDVEINLHAFVTNMAGLFDNLAWAFALEHQLVGPPKSGKLTRTQVDLFKIEMQNHLPQAFTGYLQSEAIVTWHTTYSKNYRDALAHRIPLYVSRNLLDEDARKRFFELQAEMDSLDFRAQFLRYGQLLDEQERLGVASHYAVHSFDEVRPIRFHAQTIIDFMTIDEIVERFCSTVTWSKSGDETTTQSKPAR